MIMNSRREDAEGEARARATRDGDVAGEGVVRLARRRERGGGERGGGERGEVRRGRAGAVRVPVVPCVPAHAGWGLRGSRRLIIREVGDATLVVSFSFLVCQRRRRRGHAWCSFFFLSVFPCRRCVPPRRPPRESQPQEDCGRRRSQLRGQLTRSSKPRQEARRGERAVGR